MEMDLGPLFGLWFRAFCGHYHVGADDLYYRVWPYGGDSSGDSGIPIPMEGGDHAQSEWGQMGQEIISTPCLPWAFRHFSLSSAWASMQHSCQFQAAFGERHQRAQFGTRMGYTVLLCFTSFKTGRPKSVFNAH